MAGVAEPGEGFTVETADWPLRPWLLAGLGGVAGFLIWAFTGKQGDFSSEGWRAASTAFVFFASLSAALSLDANRWKGPLLFALGAGLVMAGLAWRAVGGGDDIADPGYGFAAGVFALLLALPLFQAGFHKTRMATSYEATHYAVWTDAIGGAGAIAFTGISWAVLAILSELFHLLQIDFLRDLMGEGWFGATFSGVAFGAALGTLRNQLRVLGTLQNVVMLVLSLLAVPVAFGLAVFLLATAVSGPQVLWEATRSATPVLLACAAGAYLLVNAIIRNDDAGMTRSRIMRVAALVLAAVILPLAIFAAVSMGLRLDQYGLAPERLWGLMAIVVACAFGVGYWGALLRGRKAGWAEQLRAANFNLALGVCALALILALPVLDFGAISARNQVARLEAGKVSAGDFDYEALRWDFGSAGRKALERLAKGGGEGAKAAAHALAQKRRTYFGDRKPRPAGEIPLSVQPQDPELRRLALEYLRARPYQCHERCVVLEIGKTQDGRRQVAIIQGGGFSNVVLPLREQGNPSAVHDRPAAILKDDSKVEVRTVKERRIFIDGVPIEQRVPDAEEVARSGDTENLLVTVSSTD